MVETADFTDPSYGIPVFSLYGEVRRPTAAMMETFDVLLVDLQDLGCRIYTFVTTLRYVLEAAARARQGRVGARPAEPDRPPGRGTACCGRAGRASSAPGRCRCATACTLGELGDWFVTHAASSTSTTSVIAMEGWQPGAAPGLSAGRSASAPGSTRARTRRTSAMARCYAGTVMLEGTTLSEGRGTTRPLELFGAPDLDARQAAREHARARAATGSRAAACAPCWFEPTFHKHAGKLCARRPDPRRRSRLRPFEVPAVAAHGARVQGDPRDPARTTRSGATSPTNTRRRASRST